MSPSWVGNWRLLRAFGTPVKSPADGADQIRQRGVADMFDDVSRFARRRPAVFIGGAFLIGLGIARFLKSSSERVDDREYGSGFSSVDPMTAGTGSPSYSGDLGEVGGH